MTLQSKISEILNRTIRASFCPNDTDKTETSKQLQALFEKEMGEIIGEDWPEDMGAYLMSYKDRKLGIRLDKAHRSGYNRGKSEQRTKLAKLIKK